MAAAVARESFLEAASSLLLSTEAVLDSSNAAFHKQHESSKSCRDAILLISDMVIIFRNQIQMNNLRLALAFSRQMGHKLSVVFSSP
jgi:hypothetical protein